MIAGQAPQLRAVWVGTLPKKPRALLIFTEITDLNFRRQIRRAKRRFVLWKRRHSKPSDKPTCPFESCKLYLSAHAVVPVTADEFGRKMPYKWQWYCDELLGGCGETFVWLKYDPTMRRAEAETNSKRSNTKDPRQQRSFPIAGPDDDYVKQLIERRQRGDYT